MASRAKFLEALTIATLVAFVGAAAAWGQSSPPPKPKTKSTTQTQSKAPPPKPKRVGPTPVYVPPAVLILSADMDCAVELDGEELLLLRKDDVQEVPKLPSGEHLLQAYPLGIEDGPTWKQSIKIPETGTVVATIELKELVAEWEEETENVDRFQERDKTVYDKDTGFIWTRSVSPEMRWTDAVGYCQRQQPDGVGGWTLPSLDDLSKLHYPDHPSPRQETARSEGGRSLLGIKRRGEMQVLPRLIFEVFDHNSVSSLWVKGSDDRVSCSFLGEFNCRIESKKHTGSVFCVRPAQEGLDF